MGKALFYCFKCSRLLKEDDLDHGKAFRLGDRVACEPCARAIPGAVPDAPIHRPRSSSQHVPIPSLTPRPSHPPPPLKRSPIPFIAAGGVVLVFVIAVAALSSGRPPVPGPAESKAPAPSVGNPREDVARQALEIARKVDRESARAAALDDVVWKHPDTAAAKVAAVERDRLRSAAEDRIRNALRDLDARTAVSLAREDFAEALRLLEASAGAVDSPRWPTELGRRTRELQDKADKLYEEQRAKAADPAALRAFAVRVKSWGLKALTERIEKELPVEVSPEARGYQLRWAGAAARASTGDYPAALADLKAAAAELKDPALQAEAARDAQDLAALSTLRPKLRAPPGRVLPGRFLSLHVWTPQGTLRLVEGLVDNADAFRVRLRTGPAPVSVEWSDVAMGDRAVLYSKRSGNKPKEEPRLLALISLLEASPVSARGLIGKAAESVPEKYWAFGESGAGRPKPLPADEVEARTLLFEADRDYAAPEKLAGAAEKYRTLRDRLSGTPAAKSATERIARRADAGKDVVFGPADLRGDGAVRRDAELRWVLARDAAGAVELEFAALPGATYRIWGLLGACCAEALAVQVQGTDLPAQPLILQRAELPATHASHPARTPLRWDWVPLPVPRASAPGARKLRLSASKAGFGVAAAVVSSVRTAPPGPEDLKEAVRKRGVDAPEVFLADGLVAHWTFDEGAGAEAKDSTSNNGRAVLKGAAWAADGILGGALRVDGTGQHAEVPNTKALENVLEKSVTLAAWFLPEGLPPGRPPANEARYGILHKPGGHFGPAFDHSGKFAVEFWNADMKGYGLASEKTYAPGAWHHVAQTLNLEAGTMEVLVDGEWQGYAEIPRGAKTLDYKTQAFRIGAANPGGKEYAWPAKGLIDDVRIYARPLGLDEIRALYRLAR